MTAPHNPYAPLVTSRLTGLIVALALTTLACDPPTKQPPKQTANQTIAKAKPTPKPKPAPKPKPKPKPKPPTFDELFARAEALRTAGKLDEAVAKLGEAIEADGRDPRAHLALAGVALERKPHDLKAAHTAALDALRRARTDGDRSRALFYLGQANELDTTLKRTEAWHHPQWFYEYALKNNNDDAEIRARFKAVAPKQLATHDKMIVFHAKHSGRASQCPGQEVKAGGASLEKLCTTLKKEAAALEQRKSTKGFSCTTLKELTPPEGAKAPWTKLSVVKLDTGRQKNFHVVFHTPKGLKRVDMLNTFTPEVGGVREDATLDALELLTSADAPTRWLHAKMTRTHSDLDDRAKLFHEDLSVAHLLCDVAAKQPACVGFMEAETFSTSATMFSPKDAKQEDFLLIEQHGYQLKLDLTAAHLKASVAYGAPSPCATPVVGDHTPDGLVHPRK